MLHLFSIDIMEERRVKTMEGMRLRTYYKPNMNNLKGKVGKAVLDEIHSARKPEWDSVKKEADECIERILARRKIEKQD